MKIVTYNVNSLRQRVTQFGSLGKLLNSLDADIICFQETKLSRQDLTVDLTAVDGYEAFFSCCRTLDRGRGGYSGVATFCHVKSAFSSTEIALPHESEEGFTGLLNQSRRTSMADECEMPWLHSPLEVLDNVLKEELVKMDSEGRCIITDHGHFVLFNLYGPRADPDDDERMRFKMVFFKLLQKRWEFLLQQGKRLLIVGDLNVAPAAIDKSDPDPNFESNEVRKLLRSMLVQNGGFLFDAFRAKHPERREAYTCWPQNTGAEEFNHGSRIDHILISGPCFHGIADRKHDICNCHVSECDILLEFKRWKSGMTPRWRGQITVRLEGSDHVPVYIVLQDVPDLFVHSIPSSAARFLPEVRGRQQTIASLFLRRKEDQVAEACPGHLSDSQNFSIDSQSAQKACQSDESITLDKSHFNCRTSVELGTKRIKCSSQPTLRTFLQKRESQSFDFNVTAEGKHILRKSCISTEVPSCVGSSSEMYDTERSLCEEERKSDMGWLSPMSKNSATIEWQRIQQLMKESLPLCMGHREPCVKRTVKKGPNVGRGFYVCARAEGPKSNPEARCDHFQWASKFGTRRK